MTSLGKRYAHISVFKSMVP